MNKRKLSWVLTVLTLMSVLSSSVKSFAIPSSRFQSTVSSSPQSEERARTVREADLIRVGREALLKLKFCEEQEALAQKQITELKAANSAQGDQIKKYEEAIAKYEAAVTARTQAETFVNEMRQNYEKQLAVADKQLALEQQKARFQVTLAKAGIVVALVIGTVAGFMIGSK